MMKFAIVLSVLFTLVTCTDPPTLPAENVTPQAPPTLTCDPARFAWMKTPITVSSTWFNYHTPEANCCAENEPNVTIDVNYECHMCYGRTRSTPGFMWDPNNCQRFYMCVPDGDAFIAHRMTCPDCMFWDDNKLSCVLVDSVSCQTTGPTAYVTGTANPEFTHEPLISCIDFEDPSKLSTNGMYVLNNGVHVVENGVNGVPANFCPEGQRCGFFNASQLEIPFFAHNYNHLRHLKITFSMYATTTDGTRPEGIISNDCFADWAGITGNSLYYTVHNGDSLSGLDDKDNYYYLNGQYVTNQWHQVEIEMTDTQLKYTINGLTSSVDLYLPFTGIFESYCPLLLGSLINDKLTSYFNGYLDQICFYVDYSQ